MREPDADLVSVTTRGRVSDAEAREVLALAGAAARADGVGPLSEQVQLQLRYGGDPAARNLLLRRGHELAGYAHLGGPDPAEGRSGELVVHPAYRGHGFGLALAREVLAAESALPVRIWAHGDLPAAARLAARAGFARTRGLWQMRRPLGDPVAEPRLPPGTALRTFVPGQDEDDWIVLNARAFAGHPEQGRWTRADLEHREAEPWFDADGFLLAVRDGRLAGFHWTKIHDGGGPLGGVAGPGPAERGVAGPGPAERGVAGPGPAERGVAGPGPAERGVAGPGPAVGEIYVLGVDPTEQGGGLGKALALAGLRYLRERGMPAVMLYTEEDNEAAIRLYDSLGFAHVATDVMYSHDPARA